MFAILATVVVLGGTFGVATAATPVSSFEGAATDRVAPTNQWAYGVADNLSASWTNSSLGYTGTIHAYFGLQVTLTQTNLTANTSEVELDRTVALDFDALFCKPTCTDPTASANVSYAAWQRAVGFVNDTTNGTVTVGAVPVPALAILNASTQVTGNLTMRNVTQFRGLLGLQHSDSYYFTVQENDALALSFSPALGIVPDSLTGVSAWNSSSAYEGVGSWDSAYRYVHVPWNGTTVDLTYAPSGSLSGSGILDLYGTTGTPVTLTNGLTTQPIGLAMNGPFHLREGLLFVPGETDVLAAGGQSWSTLSAPGASTTTAALDIGTRVAHLGILAGATSYAPASSPVDVSGVTPAATNGGATVQAEPETVEASQTGSQCLVAGTCPGQQPSAGISTRSPFGGGAVIVALVIVVVVVAVLVVERRRNVPPPPHPNAHLYPPGASSGPGPWPPARPNGKSPPAAEPPVEDPLSNLW